MKNSIALRFGIFPSDYLRYANVILSIFIIIVHSVFSLLDLEMLRV